jgi:hypothetical protein
LSPDGFIAERWKFIARQQLARLHGVPFPFLGLPNSIDTLAPNDRFLEAINAILLARGLPFHSIMGDRSKGGNKDRTPPVSSDGVVPYWSSHLNGALSELIVPSGHYAHQNPQAVEEVRRILKLHAVRQQPNAREANWDFRAAFPLNRSVHR